MSKTVVSQNGIIASYVHNGGQFGAMVQVNCETCLTAQTEDLQNFANDLALHITATDPLCVSIEDIDQTTIDKEKGVYTALAKESGKPEAIIEKIVEGRLRKFYSEVCLLEQPFVKDPQQKIKDLVSTMSTKLGENITISHFVRYKLGESTTSSK